MATIREFGGLDNQNAPHEYGLRRCEVADNVDFTRAKKIVARPGRQKIANVAVDAAVHTSLGMLYQSAGMLFLMTPDGSQLVANGLDASEWLAATVVNNEIYWSNGINSGIHGQNPRPIGLPTPALPAMTQINGNMPEGDYLYTITHVRDDGFESGAGMAGMAYITLGGISLGVNQSEHRVNLYISAKGGEILYLAGSFLHGESVEFHDNTDRFSVALATQFCIEPPAFSSACLYRGRMYYLHGNALLASLPFNYELIDAGKDFVVFPNDGAFCVDVDDGIYVPDANDCHFLAGSSPDDFVLRTTPGYGATHGSGIQVDTSLIGGEAGGKSAVWVSGRGIIGGFSGGQVSNLTDGIFSPPVSASCHAGVRDYDGQEHLVFCSTEASQPYNARRNSILAHINAPSNRLDVVFAKGELLHADITGATMEILANG